MRYFVALVAVLCVVASAEAGPFSAAIVKSGNRTIHRQQARHAARAVGYSAVATSFQQTVTTRSSRTVAVPQVMPQKVVPVVPLTPVPVVPMVPAPIVPKVKVEVGSNCPCGTTCTCIPGQCPNGCPVNILHASMPIIR